MYQFVKPNRPITKVYIHCSASDNPDHDNMATMEAWHKARGWSGCGYHLFCRKNGQGELGRSIEKTPAAQGGHNRGTIAICLHGLENGKFTSDQLNWLIDVCCQIDEAYDGTVTFHGHREVAAKECPVIDYVEILNLDSVGRLGVTRSGKVAELVSHGDLSGLEEAEAGGSVSMVLRLGDKGPFVGLLQKTLKVLGYHVGAVDDDFGPLLRAAVLAFQADNHLIEDGVAGRATFEALEDAEARVLSAGRQEKTVTQLASGGSRIAQASMAQGAIGTALTAGGAAKVLEDITGVVTRLTETLGIFKGVVGDLGPLAGGVIVLCGILVVLQAMKAGRARRDDHRNGKTL